MRFLHLKVKCANEVKCIKSIREKIKNKSFLTACCFIILAIILLIGLIYQRTVKLNPDTLPIREGPGIQYKKVSNVQKRRVLILNEQNSWYEVRLSDHKRAWVPSWLIHSHTKLGSHNSLAGATIVIDPGHGGSDSGAEYKDNSGRKKYMEKTYTLQIGKRLRRELKSKGARVIMTRTKDRAVGLRERVKIAELEHADCFISLHLNSSPDHNEGSGVTTYYYHRGNSKYLAQSVSQHFFNLPLSSRGIEFGDFLVIRDTTIPSILCETGYVNTKKDFRQIRRPAFQRMVAKDIRLGVNQYLTAKTGR